MPVSVIVGGQFGSEGKGKVAHEFARLRRGSVAIRVGGPNSGHTVATSDGRTFAFRQLPTAAILPKVVCVIAPGSYVDVDLLLREKATASLDDARLLVDRNALIITADHTGQERQAQLRSRIGSTESGTGAAVVARLSRSPGLKFARDVERLARFMCDTGEILRDRLKSGQRAIIEGTQGFGLSVLHSEDYPYVTSRDTTAAAFVSEAGLSPMDVDEVVLTLRAHPIRVAGNSGPLQSEIDWGTVTLESGSNEPLIERTTVTGNVRRVGRFDPGVVKAAIIHNAPNVIVMNHLDYIDAACRRNGAPTAAALAFVRKAERLIGQKIDFVGTGPDTLIPMGSTAAIAHAS